MPPVAFQPGGAFTAYLEGRGLSAGLASWNGWYLGTYRGEHRIIIPATASDAGWIYFQARSLDPAVRDEDRYWSPAVSRLDSLVLVYPKDPTTTAVVVEGPMDALAAASAGSLGIALMGMLPPLAVYPHIAKLVGSRTVKVCADADAVPAAMTWQARLAGQGVFAPLVLPPPAYKDLADVPPALRLQMVAR